MSIVMEVNKKLELVEILLLLADRQQKTAQKLENKYYTAKIYGYFKEHLMHDAVIMTQKLIDEQNFIHIPPIQAILSLDSIRNNPEHTLHDWERLAMSYMEEKMPECEKIIIFDCEADTFSAHSTSKKRFKKFALAFHQLCMDKIAFEKMLEQII